MATFQAWIVALTSFSTGWPQEFQVGALMIYIIQSGWKAVPWLQLKGPSDSNGSCYMQRTGFPIRC